MNPQIRHVQRACEAAKARQAVVVFIDEVGQYADMRNTLAALVQLSTVALRELPE